MPKVGRGSAFASHQRDEDEPAMQAPSNQDKIFFQGVVFQLKQVEANDEPAARITATDENECLVFEGDVQEFQVNELTDGLCENVEQFIRALELAFSQSRDWSAGVTRPTGDDINDQLQGMLLQVTFDNYRKVKFTVKLHLSEFCEDATVNFLMRTVGTRTNDAFSSKPGHCHPDLDIFHKGLGLVRARGDGEKHVFATTGVKYTAGPLLEFRMTSDCMFGVLKHLTAENLESSDDGAKKSGRAQLSACYGYTGVLLDMNARTLTFYTNGRAETPKSLTGQAYYFVAAVKKVDDMIELLPEYCWHE